MNTPFKKIINQYVQLIQVKMNTDEMIFLKQFHPIEFEEKLEKFVPQFKEEYPFLFRMIISGGDLSILDTFLDNISDIDDGKKTLNDARNELGEMLNDKYINSKLNKS